MGELQRWAGASLQHHESEALTAVITKPRQGLGGLLCPCEESRSLCLSSGRPERFQLPSLVRLPRTPSGVGHVVCAAESSLPFCDSACALCPAWEEVVERGPLSYLTLPLHNRPGLTQLAKQMVIGRASSIGVSSPQAHSEHTHSLLLSGKNRVKVTGSAHPGLALHHRAVGQLNTQACPCYM